MSASNRGTHQRRHRNERGAAAVEFALVLPILLAVVFGIITYGLIFASQISLNSAARDAARAGVVAPLDGVGLSCADIANLARNSTHPLGAAQQAVAVTVTSPDAATSCSLAVDSTTVTGSGAAKLCTGSAGNTTPLVVTLSYEAKSPVPLVPGTDAKLSARGEFQCEYS